MKRAKKILLILIMSSLGLCLLLIGISTLSNLGLPQRSTVTETLSEADKIRLAETLHLRGELGDAIWAGWGQADIPAILYNEEYVFLVGYENPSDGWIKFPLGRGTRSCVGTCARRFFYGPALLSSTTA